MAQYNFKQSYSPKSVDRIAYRIVTLLLIGGGITHATMNWLPDSPEDVNTDEIEITEPNAPSEKSALELKVKELESDPYNLKVVTVPTPAKTTSYAFIDFEQEASEHHIFFRLDIPKNEINSTLLVLSGTTLSNMSCYANVAQTERRPLNEFGIQKFEAGADLITILTPSLLSQYQNSSNFTSSCRAPNKQIMSLIFNVQIDSHRAVTQDEDGDRKIEKNTGLIEHSHANAETPHIHYIGKDKPSIILNSVAFEGIGHTSDGTHFFAPVKKPEISKERLANWRARQQQETNIPASPQPD